MSRTFKTNIDRLVPVSGLQVVGAHDRVVGDATHVEVSVFYSKGGINYFNYQNEARGYWASVKPVKVTPPDPATGRFGGVAFTMFDPNAFKVFLKPATRFNAKTLIALYGRVAVDHEVIAAALVAGDKDRAAALLTAHREAA